MPGLLARINCDGTGIGLTIFTQLISMMGGPIGVLSESGQVRTFWDLIQLEEGTTRTPGAEEMGQQKVGQLLAHLFDTECLDFLRTFRSHQPPATFSLISYWESRKQAQKFVMLVTGEMPADLPNEHDGETATRRHVTRICPMRLYEKFSAISAQT